jgi:hypothetical protein
LARRPSVQHTIDFDRVAALPRRVPTLDDAEAWAEALTPSFAVSGSSARLRPWQGFSLAEALDLGGAFLALPVGVGKTLITYLWLADAVRPMLVVPASLRDKTWADFAAYRGKWKSPRSPIQIVSREELALEQNKDLLFTRKPDKIAIDEADDFANPDSAAVRRMDRYVWDEDVNVEVMSLSGTPGRTSILNYWHILLWCLRDRAPVPMNEGEAKMWALVLDHKSRAFQRPSPGPLGRNRSEALDWYSKRLQETPGVVIIDGDSCDAPITIRTRPAREDPVLDEHFKNFLVEQENPGGIQVSDPLSRWLLDGQLGCGLYSRYVHPPPEPWRVARRAVAKLVRDAIVATTRSGHPLDTEGQVLRRYAGHPVVAEWLAVKDTFVPETESVWLTTSAVQSAIDWLGEDKAPGVVWCGSVEYALALSRASRLHYYARQGKSAAGVGLHAAPVGRNLIASWAANKKGFNLQAWPRQLLVMPPPSAKWLEQIFGRSHRSGQNNHVKIDILLTSGGTRDAFEAAVGEALFNRGTIGLTQKILRANIEHTEPRLTASNKFRWATRTEKD